MLTEGKGALPATEEDGESFLSWLAFTYKKEMGLELGLPLMRHLSSI